MRISKGGRVILAALVVVVAAAAGGIAYASIPDSSGVIHACFNPGAASKSNGTELKIIDSDVVSCGKGQQEVVWNETGPQGEKGDTGETGDKGDTGDTGPAGPSAAFTNYGGFRTIAPGTTQTVASVTVPAGSYVLLGAVDVIGIDDLEFAQCSFVAASTVNGRFAILVNDGSEPILGDVTVTSTLNPIFLRCTAQGGTLQVAGQMIATQVGAITASE